MTPASPASPGNSGGASGPSGSNIAEGGAASTTAIAAIETSSIAQGIVTADAMVKRAEVELLQASVLSPGCYWILIPQLDDGVLPALRGVVTPSDADAVGVIETLTAASAIVAADAAAKAARIVLADLRLANGIGGKGVVTLAGTLPDGQAAIAAGRADAQKRGLLARAVVVPRMHPQLREHLV